MVYCGKPSKGCASCRAKKKRCDQVKPACGQCVRTGEECPGYRNPLDVSFRDQTRHVIGRANRKSHGRGNQASQASEKTTTSPLYSAFSDRGILEPFGSVSYVPIPPQLDTPLVDVATSLFFQAFVDRREGCSFDGLEDLPDLYTASNPQCVLRKVVSTMGMSVLSRRHQDPTLMNAALKEYFKVINEVNVTLCDPKGAQSDDVLMTVMLLALFEMYTCKTPQCFRAWQTHLDGAKTLIKLRGPGQFQSRAGVRMFRRLRMQITISSIERGDCVPHELLALAKQGQNFETGYDRIFSDLLDRFARFSSVRASIQHKKRLSPEEIIEALLEADEDLALWPVGLPAEYSCTKITGNPSVASYGDQYEVYQSVRAAVLWCAYRCMRIILQKMILDYGCTGTLDSGLGPTSPSRDPRRTVFEDKIAELGVEVCAVVPYLLNYTTTAPNEVIKPTTIGAGSLIWPLYVVASNADGESNSTFQWVRNRLLEVAEGTGIQQATLMAKLLTSKIDISDWKVGKD